MPCTVAPETQDRTHWYHLPGCEPLPWKDEGMEERRWREGTQLGKGHNEKLVYTDSSKADLEKPHFFQASNFFFTSSLLNWCKHTSAHNTICCEELLKILTRHSDNICALKYMNEAIIQMFHGVFSVSQFQWPSPTVIHAVYRHRKEPHLAT